MSWVLAADIGGTSCRLARADDGALSEIAREPTAAFLTERILDFAKAYTHMPRAIIIAAAGLVFEGKLRLTNADAVIDIDQVKRAFDHIEVHVLNDFEAAAWALSLPNLSELRFLQGDALGVGQKAIIGVGTGLGVGLWTGHDALKTEGGHTAAFPMTSQESKMFPNLAKLWPETAFSHGTAFEVEALVSGTGLPHVQAAFAPLFDETPLHSIEEVIARASSDHSSSTQAVATFERHLGRVVGDLFVSYWATGGIILTGGVLRKNPGLLGRSFWQAVHDGGRYVRFRQTVPIALWDSDDIGLLGCVAFASDRT